MGHATLLVKMAVLSAANRSFVHASREKVSCKPKCNACCSRHLLITLAEASIIVEYLRQMGRWDKVREAAEEQQEMCRDINPVAWFKMGLKCPVLDAAGLCSAYAVRPAACSAHFVSSKPELCSPSMERGEYVPSECVEALSDFAKSFEAAVGRQSPLRLRAPMAIALIAASKDPLDKDFDSLIERVRREFGQ